MPKNYEWTSNRKGCHNTNPCTSFEVSIHPLKTSSSHTVLSSNKSFVENLNKWSAGFEEMDPLLRFEKMNTEEDMIPEEVQNGVNYTKVWNTRRSAILTKYTTGEKLTIVSSFLPGGEKALIRQVSNLNEKVKHRLEQLDDFDESSIHKTMGLSQQEYVSKINMLSDEIKKAWDTEQRVKAFKIVIQCSKLLSDVSVMQFYPSKFVLITDIIDSFGDLVFNRLKAKSFGQHQVISLDEIDHNEVPESARETCQNWMFKMASIRELLPRMFMEMALLKCYLFINKKEIKPTISRITKMIRGIGNPLVAVYLRVYLCRVASRLLNKDSEEYFYENFKEFITDYQQVFHPMMQKKYEMQLLALDRYLNLYVPAVDWLLFGALNSNKSNLSLLQELLRQCREIENNELLLYCTVSAFDSESVIENAQDILEIVQNSGEKYVLTSEILCAVGEHLCKADGSRRLPSEALIQCWWKITNNMPTTTYFLQVIEPWLQFAVTHLSIAHVNLVLRGCIRYMAMRNGAGGASGGGAGGVTGGGSGGGSGGGTGGGGLLPAVRRLLAAADNHHDLLLMDSFMPLVELVQTSSARVQMAKTVLTMFYQKNSSQIDDHLIISNLMRLCCILHDSINAVTVEDECKLCADLIIKFVYSVTFRGEVDQQLNFYVECRAAFIKLDAVLVALVHAVNSLSSVTSPVRGRLLQRACAAYCFVTVPSLRCALTKAQLYLLGGQVALTNNCIGQAEANFKALIGLIPDIPEFIFEDAQKKPTSTRVAGLLSNLLSTLLVLPDNVDSNCKAYILSGFIKLMERIHWIKTDPLYYGILLKMLDLLSAMTQEKYAYHLESVISNDKLYGSDPVFIQTLDSYATNICQELLVILKLLGDQRETKKQHSLALELFWRVTRRADLNEGPMLSLAVNLWGLAKKVQDANDKLDKSILTSLKEEKDPVKLQLLHKLEQV